MPMLVFLRALWFYIQAGGDSVVYFKGKYSHSPILPHSEQLGLKGCKHVSQTVFGLASCLFPADRRHWQEKSRPQEERSLQFLTLPATAAVTRGEWRCRGPAVAAALGTSISGSGDSPGAPLQGRRLFLCLGASPFFLFCSSSCAPLLFYSSSPSRTLDKAPLPSPPPHADTPAPSRFDRPHPQGARGAPLPSSLPMSTR